MKRNLDIKSIIIYSFMCTISFITCGMDLAIVVDRFMEKSYGAVLFYSLFSVIMFLYGYKYLKRLKKCIKGGTT